jgi:hypothetical protein
MGLDAPLAQACAGKDGANPSQSNELRKFMDMIVCG